jgi:TrmH family RNA methyltransferase
MITSAANPRVQWIRSLQRKRRVRQAEGLFVIEGVRLGEEALRAGVIPRLVVHGPEIDQRASSLVQAFAHRGASILAVSERVLAACASTEAPQGIVAAVPSASPPAPERLTLAVVIDGLADPGNLGTLLRTALGAGAEAVFLTAGTVDAYNPKVVRAAMGAHFHLPLIGGAPEAIMERLGRLPLWLAQPRGGRPYDHVDLRSPLALVIGGEAHGPGDIWRRHAAGVISVPTEGTVESLNAAIAAAVILFEVRRQRGTALSVPEGTAPSVPEGTAPSVPEGTAPSVPEGTVPEGTL